MYDFNEEPIYTPKQVAERIHCDLGHVYDLIRSGLLRASDISTGRKAVWRIRHSALMDFLHEREAKPAPQVQPRKSTPVKAKPVDILGDKAVGLYPSFAAQVEARRAAKQKGA